MKKLISIITIVSIYLTAYSQGTDTTSNNVVKLDGVTVTSVLGSHTSEAQTIMQKEISNVNVGQEPSHVFKSMPSIYARSDNGTDFGYGYYYIRGFDQTRINVTLDGMPWNEAEDFGTYFANSPDLMGSLHSMTVERGTSSKTIGISASAGNILLESVNLRTDTTSYLQGVYGSFNTYKVSGVYNMGIKKGFGLHVRATTSHTDGYRENSWNNSHALTAKLGYFFNDRHNIDFISINGYHSNCQGWIGVTENELETNPRANGNTRLETDNWIQSINKISYKGWLSDNTVLMGSLYLQYQTGSYRFDLDNYMSRIEVFPISTGIIYDYGLTHYLYGGNIMVKSFIGKVASIYGGVNAYGYQREHYMDNRNRVHWSNVDTSEFYDNIGYKVDVTPFFGVNFVFDKFSLGGNLQFRYVDFRYNDKTVGICLSANDMNTRWYFFNGGIDMSYQFNNEHNLYAKLAVSNREPTRSDMFGGNEHLHADSISLKGLCTTTPELVHDVEFGWNLDNRYVKANVNLFYMHFKNELVLNGTLGTNGLPGHENAKDSYRTGVEVTVMAEPFRGFHLANSTSYSYGEITTESFGLQHHVFFPAWTLNQDIYYDNLHVGCAKFMFGVNYYFRSPIHISLPNDKILPSNMSLNVYCNVLVKKHVELGVRFNNITNHKNYSYGSINGAGELLYVQEARFNFLASLKYIF